MKLNDLRGAAQRGECVTTLEKHEVSELVADIDAAIGAAKLGAPDRHPYRDGCRTGWKGAIEKMRSHLKRDGVSWCSETESMLKLLDEMSGANDVPEPIHVEHATHEKRLRDLEVLYGKIAVVVRPAGEPERPDLRERIRALEQRLNEVANCAHDHRGTILHDIDVTLLAYRKMIEVVEKDWVQTAALVSDLQSQVSNIHNGVTGPAQLVPEIIKRLEALERGRTPLEKQHVARVDALEQWRKECSTAVIPWPADVLRRIETLEKKLEARHKMGEAQTQSFDQRLSALEQRELSRDMATKTLRSDLDALNLRIANIGAQFAKY